MRDYLAKELLKLLGEKDYLRLLEHYGGLRIYIAENNERSQISQKLGLAVAQKLYARYGNDSIRIPLDRNFRIAYYHCAGHSVREIARRLCLTENGVYRALGRPLKRL